MRRVRKGRLAGHESVMPGVSAAPGVAAGVAVVLDLGAVPDKAAHDGRRGEGTHEDQGSPHGAPPGPPTS